MKEQSCHNQDIESTSASVVSGVRKKVREALVRLSAHFVCLQLLWAIGLRFLWEKPQQVGAHGKSMQMKLRHPDITQQAPKNARDRKHESGSEVREHNIRSAKAPLPARQLEHAHGERCGLRTIARGANPTTAAAN